MPPDNNRLSRLRRWLCCFDRSPSKSILKAVGQTSVSGTINGPIGMHLRLYSRLFQGSSLRWLCEAITDELGARVERESEREEERR